MKKDQGIGTVVNNILYRSLGHQMVFKVVRLKKERLNCCLPFSRISLVTQSWGRCVTRQKGDYDVQNT